MCPPSCIHDVHNELFGGLPSSEVLGSQLAQRWTSPRMKSTRNGIASVSQHGRKCRRHAQCRDGRTVPGGKTGGFSGFFKLRRLTLKRNTLNCLQRYFLLALRCPKIHVTNVPPLPMLPLPTPPSLIWPALNPSGRTDVTKDTHFTVVKTGPGSGVFLPLRPPGGYMEGTTRFWQEALDSGMVALIPEIVGGFSVEETDPVELLPKCQCSSSS